MKRSICLSVVWLTSSLLPTSVFPSTSQVFGLRWIWLEDVGTKIIGRNADFSRRDSAQFRGYSGLAPRTRLLEIVRPRNQTPLGPAVHHRSSLGFHHLYGLLHRYVCGHLTAQWLIDIQRFTCVYVTIVNHLQFTFTICIPHLLSHFHLQLN